MEIYFQKAKGMYFSKKRSMGNRGGKGITGVYLVTREV